VADNDLRPPSTTVVRWWALRLVLAHHNQLLVRSRRSLAGPAVTVCVPGSPGGPGRDTGELRIHIPNSAAYVPTTSRPSTRPSRRARCGCGSPGRRRPGLHTTNPSLVLRNRTDLNPRWVAPARIQGAERPSGTVRVRRGEQEGRRSDSPERRRTYANETRNETRPWPLAHQATPKP
jgi:hypothetical protein